MSNAMMTLDIFLLLEDLKNEEPLGFLLNGNELLQHVSDPLQLLLNGDQKFMSVSTRPFLNQFQFHLFIFKSLEIPDLFFGSRDGEPILVQEFLDLQNEVQVFPPVEPL